MVDLLLQIQANLINDLSPTFLIVLLISMGIVVIFIMLLALWSSEQRITQELKQEAEVADNRLKKAPPQSREQLEAAFKVVEVQLSSYLNDNARQNRRIFQLTVIMIIAGFLLIIFGMYIYIWDKSSTSERGQWVIVAAGVITEFIAATILFVYTSISKQTTRYFNTIAKFEAARYSIYIVDAIDDNDMNQNIKNSTKAEIAKLLMQGYKEESILSIIDNPTKS